MTSLRKFSIVLLVVAALAGLLAVPVQAAVSVSCNIPSSLVVSQSNTISCSASGGTPPYTFSITSGSVPSGMSTNSGLTDFVINGSPISTGTYSFTLQATDSATPANVGSGSFTATVTTSSGTTGTSVTLTSVSPSTLSAGVATFLTLFGSGFTTTSTVYFNGNPITANYVSSSELTVTVPGAYITGGTLPVYVNASGVTSGDQYVTVSGSSSTGVSLSSLSPNSAGLNSSPTIVIFGSGFTSGVLVNFGNLATIQTTLLSNTELEFNVPAAYMTTSQVVNVTVGASNSLPFTIGTPSSSSGTITVSCSPASGPSTLGGGYEQVCAASGGTGSYTSWFVSGLPAGVSYSPSGSEVIITGTPTTNQSYSYTIQVTDSSGNTGTASFSGTIGSGGSGTSGVSLSSLSPSSAAVSTSTTLFVFGSGFTGSSIIYFNGFALPTSYVNSGELSASLSSAYLTTTENVGVTVYTSGTPSNSLPFTVGSGSSSSGVTLSSISPTSTALNTATTVTLFGSGFSQGVDVSFGSLCTLGSSYINSSEITVLVPASCLTTAQTVNVSVGSSNSVPFVIGAGSSTGSLSITCSPTTGPSALGVAFNQYCSVTGGNGVYTWSVTGLPSGLTDIGTSGTQTTISGAPSTATSYSYTVEAFDTAGHVGSIPFSGTIGSVSSSYNITSLSPSSLPVGSGTTTLTVFGTGFTGASTVYFNGTAFGTTYVSSGELIATLSSGYLTSAGTFNVDVYSNGTFTNTLPFTVGTSSTSGLSLSSISPSSVAAGSGSFTLTLFGTGFTAGQLVNFGSFELGSSFINSSELQVTVPASYITTTGTINVSVASSNALQFTITGTSTGALPLSCSPASGPSTTNVSFNQTCTVSGGVAPYTFTVSNLPAGLSQSAYNGTSTVTISGVPNTSQSYSYTIIVTDSSSPTHLTGSLSITGTVSASNSSYNISSISPATIPVGSGATTVAVFGNGFNGASVVYFNGTQLQTSYVSATQVNATIQANYLTAAETVSIYVNTSGVQTNSLTLTVGSGGTTSGLIITCTSGVGPQTLNIAYSTTCTASGGLQPYTWATPNTLPAYLTYSASTGSSITISGTPNVASPYNYTVKVTDSSSPTLSGALQFAGETNSSTTTGSGILVTSVSPSSAAVNSAAVTITVLGSGFSTNSQVIFGGFPITTTVNNGSQLTAVIPPGLLTAAQDVLVTVTTPGAAASNGVTFIVGSGSTSGAQMTIGCNPGVGPATPNVYYTTNCNVNGGRGPYTWTVVSGTLPTGLSLSSNGPSSTITGYSTLNGAYSYTLQVTDSSSPANVAQLVFAGATGATSGTSSGLTISSLSPTSVPVGSGQTTLTVIGNNFSTSALVYFNGIALSTTYISSGQLTAIIPSTDLTTAESASITVISSGATSNGLTFTVGTSTTTSGITINCNPSIGPSSGGSSYTTTCSASGGTAPYAWTGLNMPFGLAVTYSTSNTVSITGTLFSGAYNFTLQVTDSSTPPITATYPFIGSLATNVSSAMTSITPISAPAGSGQITMTITGYGFVSGVTGVQFGSTFLPAVVNSTNSLTVTVPATLLTSPGNQVIELTGTPSNSADFFVTLGGASGVTPASMTFTYGIGGTVPPAQTLSVTNINGATGFSAVANGISDNVNWLVLNQGSSTIPGSISVSVAPGSLPIGSYTGTISLTGFAVGTTVTIPVTLTVTSAPVLVSSNTNITLTAPEGASVTQTVNITSSNSATVFPFKASVVTNNGGNWLTVTPTTGTTPGSLTLTASAANLPPSTYSASVTLVSTGSVGAQTTIPVTLTVTQPASLTVTPTSLSFSGQSGSTIPGNQTISVSAGGSATVNYTVTATSTGNWLVATGSGTTPGSIAVSINTGILAGGTYNGTITITAPGTTNSPITVPVTLTLASGPVLTGAPTTFAFTAAQGGSAPAAQALAISAPSGSTASFNYTVTAATTSGGNWLSTSPTTGTTPSSVNISVNPANLTAGSYSGTVTVSASGAGSLTVPVTFTVTGSATLSVSPSSLTFNATVGSSTPPSAQNLSVTTTNNVTANYTVTATTASGGNWLSATASGTTPGTVSVSVNQAGLALGQYTGTVSIASISAANSPQTVQVTLNVQPAAAISAVPSALTFFVPGDGSTPAPQSVTVISTNAGNTAFTVSEVSQGGNWLTVGSGGTTPGSFMVSVNPSGLLAGTYNGSITITAPNANPGSFQVPVALTVASTATVPLQVAPSTLYLSYAQGAGTDLQHVAVLNPGGGNVGFAASAQTSSCGSWLTVLTPTGSAAASSPGLLAFDVNPSGITQQTCTGELTLTDANGNIVNVPVFMAVSGSTQSVLLSQTAMTFYAEAAGPAPPSQTFQILNPGTSPMQWTATAQTLSGGPWLSVAPTSGSSQTLAQPGSPITVTVNPQGLTGGAYYGTVLVTSSGAFNSPQAITVTVYIGPPGQNPPEQISPNGVIITAANGTASSATVTLSDIGPNPVNYASAVITDDGQNWLTASPATGTVSSASSNAITVSANVSGLSPGLRHGVLRIALSDGNVETVDVKLVISGSPSTPATGVNGCGSSNLALEFLAPAQGFGAIPGTAIPLQVLVQDCMGNLLTNSSTGADVLVGSTDIKLNYTGNGIWAGTWTPSTGNPSTILTATAVEVTGGTQATGSVSVSGNVGPVPTNGGPPLISAVVNAGSFLYPGLAAPGAMVSIFGANLTDGQTQVFTVPFPITLENAQFSVRGLPLALFYASPTQVNAVVPFGLSPILNADERDQLLAVRDNFQSAPVDLLVADVNPGIFTTSQSGTGQGAILVGGTSQLAAPSGSVPGAGPATAGQTVSIFLAGGGVVSNPPVDGSPSTGNPPSTTSATATVTIGGIPATVTYSGLAPGEVGLYQVNAVVPAGVPTGNTVPVVVTLGNGVSNTVTIAIM